MYLMVEKCQPHISEIYLLIVELIRHQDGTKFDKGLKTSKFDIFPPFPRQGVLVETNKNG